MRFVLGGLSCILRSLRESRVKLGREIRVAMASSLRVDSQCMEGGVLLAVVAVVVVVGVVVVVVVVCGSGGGVWESVSSKGRPLGRERGVCTRAVARGMALVSNAEAVWLCEQGE